MPKKVHNKVLDNRLLDGGTEIEDVTSVTMPDVSFTSDEFDVPGLAAAINMPDPSHLEAMTFSIANNNGMNCELLAEPRKHAFEFRLAQQFLDAIQGKTGNRSIKYRVHGFPTKISDGTIERGNPIGQTIDYSVTRYEKEIDGVTVVMVDVLANKVVINGTDYSSDISKLLN